LDFPASEIRASETNTQISGLGDFFYGRSICMRKRKSGIFRRWLLDELMQRWSPKLIGGETKPLELGYLSQQAARFQPASKRVLSQRINQGSGNPH
jgi:hypothetical protein